MISKTYHHTESLWAIRKTLHIPWALGSTASRPNTRRAPLHSHLLSKTLGHGCDVSDSMGMTATCHFWQLRYWRTQHLSLARPLNTRICSTAESADTTRYYSSHRPCCLMLGIYPGHTLHPSAWHSLSLGLLPLLRRCFKHWLIIKSFKQLQGSKLCNGAQMLWVHPCSYSDWMLMQTRTAPSLIHSFLHLTLVTIFSHLHIQGLIDNKKK